MSTFRKDVIPFQSEKNKIFLFVLFYLKLEWIFSIQLSEINRLCWFIKEFSSKSIFFLLLKKFPRSNKNSKPFKESMNVTHISILVRHTKGCFVEKNNYCYPLESMSMLYSYTQKMEVICVFLCFGKIKILDLVIAKYFLPAFSTQFIFQKDIFEVVYFYH